MADAKDYDYLIKFLIIGESAVGKTAMLLRYTENTFTEDFLSTIGVDFKVKRMERDGKKLKIQVWDTGLFFFYFDYQSLFYLLYWLK